MHPHIFNLRGMLLCLFSLGTQNEQIFFGHVLFFSQVLHLMNKMNIPAPFRMALPTPPLPSHAPAPQPPPPPQPSTTEQLRSVDLSSDESELESSDVCSSSAFLFSPRNTFVSLFMQILCCRKMVINVKINGQSMKQLLVLQLIKVLLMKQLG